MEAFFAWLPDAQTVYSDLRCHSTLHDSYPYVNITSWKGMRLHWNIQGRADGGDGFFSPFYWTQLSARHWEIPLTAVAIYLLAIPLLQLVVAKRGRFNVRNFAFWWNCSLSLFSWLGSFACIPVIAASLYEHGLYFTTCAPASWFGSGINGLFVMLFIYSKIFELVDTGLLLLSNKPVIALQWWHHATVLLYCWHSFSVRIATGAWFAGMNYAVHSIMYGYFAATATKYRKYVAPFAICITFLQLMQMVVGIFITLKAVQYQIRGEECHVNKTNSLLGLIMYASYFVLFFKLFVDNYLLKPKSRAAKDNATPLSEVQEPVAKKQQPRSAETKVGLRLRSVCLDNAM